jgi:hypothetical protein
MTVCLKISTLATTLVLAGCVTDPSQLQPLPPPATIELIGKQAYINTLGRNPRNFKVVKVSSSPLWGQRDWSHYACVTATEPQTGDLYDASGKLISREGIDYTQTYVMTFQDYTSKYSSTGWAVGLFKRATDGVKIVDRDTRALCPM